MTNREANIINGTLGGVVLFILALEVINTLGGAQ